MSLGQIFVAAAEMNTEIIFGISTEYANVLCWADGGILIMDSENINSKFFAASELKMRS